MACLLYIDKPIGITSHDVVYSVRKATGEKKVGHAGTLDPQATGLLIVGVGRQATKKLGSIAKDTKKRYEAEIKLGETRDTDDSEGKLLSKNETVPSTEYIKKVLKEFTGTLEQIPPVFSALKIKGKPAYKLAREGKAPTLDSRIIIVHSLKLLSYEYPLIRIDCEVSSGTYIRALARDIGEALGTGAYLSGLRRTAIGDVHVSQAIELEKLTPDTWDRYSIPLE